MPVAVLHGINADSHMEDHEVSFLQTQLPSMSSPGSSFDREEEEGQVARVTNCGRSVLGSNNADVGIQSYNWKR